MTDRLAIITAVTLLLSGCTTLSESPPVNVNPLSANGGQWSISAKAETGMLYDDVTLFVNGTKVAVGTLGPSNHHDIHITGSYDHHIVLGICSRSDGEPIAYHCDVLVDGSNTATLSWRGEE